MFGFLIVLGVVVVGVEIYFIFGACHRRGKLRLMKDTPTSKIGDITDGYREIKGRVAAADENELLKAPMTGRRCVYYEFMVRESSSDPQGGGTTREIIREEKSVDWHLDDGTGVASIDLEGAELMLDTKHEESGAGSPASPELKALLAKYNESSGGFWRGTRSLDYYETILEEGDRLYILGPATVVEGRVCFKTSSSSEQPLIVGDKSERDLFAEQESAAFIYMLLAVLLPVVVVVGLIVYLNR